MQDYNINLLSSILNHGEFQFSKSWKFLFQQKIIEMYIVPMVEDLDQGEALKYEIM